MSKILAVNRRARFDYEILEKFEAGLKLAGHEVKSARAGKVSLKGAFVTIHQGEAYLTNAHISPYQPKNIPPSYDPTRPRKLLLKKKELKSLIGKQKGLTIIPLKIYTKRHLIKLEIALAKGKKKIDKREVIKKREAERMIRRVMREKA